MSHIPELLTVVSLPKCECVLSKNNVLFHLLNMNRLLSPTLKLKPRQEKINK